MTFSVRGGTLGIDSEVDERWVEGWRADFKAWAIFIRVQKKSINDPPMWGGA